MRGQKIVLDDMNLRVQLNEHVALLGPNGCGKSTLIKTITRECYPVAREGASITILGQQDWNVFELRSLLGIANVIEGFGLSHSVRTALYDQLITVATSVFNGDAVATCQAFDGFTASANAQLTAGQFASLTPSINAARTTLGC